jgi:hypothetical protein
MQEYIPGSIKKKSTSSLFDAADISSKVIGIISNSIGGSNLSPAVTVRYSAKVVMYSSYAASKPFITWTPAQFYSTWTFHIVAIVPILKADDDEEEKGIAVLETQTRLAAAAMRSMFRQLLLRVVVLLITTGCRILFTMGLPLRVDCGRFLFILLLRHLSELIVVLLAGYPGVIVENKDHASLHVLCVVPVPHETTRVFYYSLKLSGLA